LNRLSESKMDPSQLATTLSREDLFLQIKAMADKLEKLSVLVKLVGLDEEKDKKIEKKVVEKVVEKKVEKKVVKKKVVEKVVEKKVEKKVVKKKVVEKVVEKKVEKKVVKKKVVEKKVEKVVKKCMDCNVPNEGPHDRCEDCAYRNVTCIVCNRYSYRYKMVVASETTKRIINKEFGLWDGVTEYYECWVSCYCISNGMEIRNTTGSQFRYCHKCGRSRHQSQVMFIGLGEFICKQVCYQQQRVF